MKHRRDIDGLRSVAIVPVMLFHAGFSWVKGGYLGVDVFFVISGFLITSILVTELDATGTISIVGFYERRVRRIVPALVVVVVFSVLVGLFVLMPSDWKQFVGSIAAIVFFASNYYFMQHTDYFGIDVELNPMLHTWSLAVEEQFYLLFPLALWVMWRFVRARWWLPLLVAVALFSLILAQRCSVAAPTQAFYQIQFRAWELLAGSITALVVVRMGKMITNGWVPTVALALVVGSMFTIGADVPSPGYATAIPVIGTAILLGSAAPTAWSHRILSSPIPVHIGLISYSAYLWHQPAFAFIRLLALKPVPPLYFVPVIGFVLWVAHLSWRYVERPFRSRSGFTRKQVFTRAAAAGIAVLLFAAVASVPAVATSRAGFGTPSVLAQEQRIGGALGLSLKCRGFFADEPKCRTSENPDVLVWGDSFGMALSKALSVGDTQHSIVEQTFHTCAPLPGLSIRDRVHGQFYARACIQFNDNVLRWLGDHPDITYVVLASRWEALKPGNLVGTLSGHVMQTNAQTSRSLMDLIGALETMGKKVVVVAPPPADGSDLGRCVVRAHVYGVSTDRCDFALGDDIHASTTAQLRDVVPADQLFTWDRLVCPNGTTCDAEQDGRIVYQDAAPHLTIEYATYIGETYDLLDTLVAMAR